MIMKQNTFSSKAENKQKSAGGRVKSETTLTNIGLFCRYTVCSFLSVVKYISIQGLKHVTEWELNEKQSILKIKILWKDVI